MAQMFSSVSPLKDISTVGYRPQNLMVWAETVSDVLDWLYEDA